MLQVEARVRCNDSFDGPLKCAHSLPIFILLLVQSHFHAERLAQVGFDLVQALDQFIEIVGHGHDLAASDADEFPGQRGGGVVPRLFIDLPG